MKKKLTLSFTELTEQLEIIPPESLKDYYGGDGSTPNGPGFTDCFEVAFDHYMTTLAGASSGSCYTGAGVVDSYDSSRSGSGSGNTPDQGGVNPSDYDDLMSYAANLNGFDGAVTRSATDMINSALTVSGSGSSASTIIMDGIGAYNDPNSTNSHAVNITGMYKDANGVWQVQYQDFQSNPNNPNPPVLEMPASNMAKVTIFNPCESGSGS